MKITVFGTGYVGLVTATCLAEMGHEVLGIDKDEAKINQLNQGLVPFYEPGLQELIQKNSGDRRLSFSTDAKVGIEYSDVLFSAVSAPLTEDGDIDLTAVYSVAKAVGDFAENPKVLINKSTVPVGTAAECKRLTGPDHEVISNPEFLREGAAVKDFLNPERIVIGVDSDKTRALAEKLYRPLVRAGKPLFITDVKSAELIKYAANSFLATKISFINEMADYCEQVGADIGAVAKGIGLDSRIGTRFLHAGIGYGGSCLPKDVKALMKQGDFELLKAVDKVNERQLTKLVSALKQKTPDLKGGHIAVWGLSFKPRTDDVREAPALKIVQQLLDEGAEVHVFDPMAMPNAQKVLTHPKLTYCSSANEALKGVDALLVLTEWDEFRAVELHEIIGHMKGNTLIDGRNVYDPDDARDAGFDYVGIGRPQPKSKIKTDIKEVRTKSHS